MPSLADSSWAEGFRRPGAAIRFSLSASRNQRALPAAGSQPGPTPPFWTGNNGQTTMARSSDLAILVHLISDEQLNLRAKSPGFFAGGVFAAELPRRASGVIFVPDTRLGKNRLPRSEAFFISLVSFCYLERFWDRC